MRFNSVLVSSLLFVSAALAGRHDKHRRSQSLNPNDPRSTGDNHNSLFAGTMLEMPADTFTFITGNVIVPNVSGESGDCAIIAVTMDSSPAVCNSPTIWAAVLLDVGGNAQVFLQWLPGSLYQPSLAISPGDEIQLSIGMTDPKTAFAMVRNVAIDQTAIQHFSSPNEYCGGVVAWGVYTSNGDTTHLANFSNVTFTGASAINGSNTYLPGAGVLYDIEEQTRASATDSSVVIEYVA